MSAEQVPFRNADLPYRLRALGMAGAVLHLGAHPDDEEAGLMAYLSRGLGVRAVYWSATRGEGGQNRTGPERAEALGILRTWESLDARALDGGELLYGPFYDFGFSRRGEDALARWEPTAVVREIVRAIRHVQPDVIVSRWTGGAEDGHGHHQAVGLAAIEAIDAAADPAAFTELGPAWQVRKHYRSAIGDWQPGEDVSMGQRSPELERQGLLRLNLGAYDPISGRSFQELASMGANRHQSQAMAFLPARGDHFTYYRLERSLVPTEGGFFDGIDPTLAGLADLAHDPDASLRPLLESARDRATEATAAFRPDRPDEAGSLVLQGLRSLKAAREVAGEGDAAIDRYLSRKIEAFEDAAARCLGIDLECLIDGSHLTPGTRALVRTRLWSSGGHAIEDVRVELDVPRGWNARPLPWSLDEEEAELGPTLSAFEVTVPAAASLTGPYWLREPREPSRYVWPEVDGVGLPFDPPQITARCEVDLGGDRLSLTRPAVRRETFVGGSRELPPQVVPPVSLRPQEQRQLLAASGREERLGLHLAVRSMRDGVSGTVRIDVPDGWDAQPVEVQVELPQSGDVHTIPLEVVLPADAKPGVHEIRYRAEADGRDFGVVLQPVRRRAPGLGGPVDESNCIAEAFVTRPAAVSIHLIQADVIGRLKHAYIRGADEDILPALEHFGLDVAVVSPEELAYVDLDAFDDIVVGPNAYLIADVRRNAPRLLAYVERGGTLIVQYQAYGYQGGKLAPYPFRYHQPHDRITFPDAPVRILDPEHPILSVPNRIGPEDFDGWVHDRGLYFFGEWDRRYEPLLESADPGQDPQRGGLLVAGYGRGTYVYAAYSFFRQIPEGVPGAVRLFVNLLGLAEARIRDRMERARRIPLLSLLEEEQLYEVSRLMSERWLDPGDFLCREGDNGRELYLILDGGVEVIKGADPGRVVHVAENGEVVGELAVLTDLPRSATLRAKTGVKLLEMRGAHFRDYLRDHKDLAERVTSLLARRLSSSEVMW